MPRPNRLNQNDLILKRHTTQIAQLQEISLKEQNIVREGLSPNGKKLEVDLHRIVKRLHDAGPLYAILSDFAR